MIPETHPIASRSLADIHDSIESVESTDLSSTTADALLPKIKRVVEGYAWFTQTMKLKVAYRARILTNAPQHISDIWYPPAHKIKKIGRCNDIGESIFYCSEDQGTAILELRPTNGTSLAILQMLPAQQDTGPKVFEIAIAENNTDQLSDQKVREKYLIKFGFKDNSNAEMNFEKLHLIRNFFVKHFTRIVEPSREFNYAISLAIAKLHRDTKMDGLWYPSIASGLKGNNLALTPTAADRFLKPYSCWMITVEKSLPNNEYLVRCTGKAKAIHSDGLIEW
jgi:RES domain